MLFNYYIKIFTFSLLFTFALEYTAAWILGVKDKKDLLLLLPVNTLTNPAVVCIYLLLSTYTTVPKLVLQIPLEIVVIFTEGYVYARYGCSFRHPFLFSLAANLLSYGTGLLLG